MTSVPTVRAHWNGTSFVPAAANCEVRWKSNGAMFAAACLGYAVLAAGLFHRLIGQLSSAVPHDLGDPLLSTWILWWSAHHVPFVGQWWDGLAFFPGHGSLAFSDHRVGLELIAGPIQWFGGTPVLAYNLTLLASFVLSALAAHALTWTLTRNHGAGSVSGLIFGFNPYRISHIAHLELLAAFWLPFALLTLHLYVHRYELRWLLLFAALWLLQGLSSGYYLFYSAPLIGLWALWFIRERRWRHGLAVLAACAAVVLLLMPVLLQYRAIQDRLLLTRGFGEVVYYGADVTGLLSATPIMALWRLPSLAANGEGEIYIGIFAPLLVLVAALWYCDRDPSGTGPAWLRPFRALIAVTAVVSGAVAGAAAIHPWKIVLGPAVLSASRTDRPLTVVIGALIVLALTSRAFLRTAHRGSAFAFYAFAAVVMWILSLGPAPRLLGRPFLYRGPYALLMWLPGFDARLRAPARFIMMTVAAVSVAAGIGFVRLTASASRRMRAFVLILLLAAITADSWTFTCPIVRVPVAPQLPAGVLPASAVMELPLGGVAGDIAAVYHSISHRHPVVNGYSGYEPPHYRVLRAGLSERDDSVLTSLATHSPLAVLVRQQDDPLGDWTRFVARHSGAMRVSQTDGYALFLLPPVPPEAPIADGYVPFRRVASTAAVGSLRTTETVLELDRDYLVSAVSVATGPAVERFPPWLTVDTSGDRQRWETVWDGGLAGAALEGALKDPRIGRSDIRFRPRPARFVRLRTRGGSDRSGNDSITGELGVYGAAIR